MQPWSGVCGEHLLRGSGACNSFPSPLRGEGQAGGEEPEGARPPHTNPPPRSGREKIAPGAQQFIGAACLTDER